MAARGVVASFRATGGSGILIAGGSVVIDAVVSDFVAGAAEALSPANATGHRSIIEVVETIAEAGRLTKATPPDDQRA